MIESLNDSIITMLSKETFNFLKDLDKNNNRDWFNANKKEFEKAKENLTAFTGYLIGEVSKFDAEIRRPSAPGLRFSYLQGRPVLKRQKPVQDEPRRLPEPGRPQIDGPRILFSRPARPELYRRRASTFPIPPSS